ncbi:MAG: flagellar biosynthetic protein FliO [Candidatus Kryptonium sp.]|nr:flagellar biosynthetic protein FliO [Candidatus Kryptonium sp.]MCX7762800.1 flagellar biosynthetic protein FliO [Candidatus Kryptonium sp.]MDW8109243.1 flagellar biosynthetic protein FliO [Candidatus Kryptonium sp.]
MELLAKTILSFGVVVILIFSLSYFLKKFYPALSTSSDYGIEMRIYKKLQIQPRKSIYLIKVLNKILVIGVSENSMNVLAEINDPEIVRVLDDIYSSSNEKNGKFLVLK